MIRFLAIDNPDFTPILQNRRYTQEDIVVYYKVKMLQVLLRVTLKDISKVFENDFSILEDYPRLAKDKQKLWAEKLCLLTATSNEEQQLEKIKELLRLEW